MESLTECRILPLPRIQDPRGNLTFIEGGRHIPFRIQRTYWIYDVPGGEVRGGHAFQSTEECFVSLSGSFDIVVDDGTTRETFSLNRSFRALYVPALRWRQVENFSTNSVCLVLASAVFSEADYLREYPKFLERVRGTSHAES